MGRAFAHGQVFGFVCVCVSLSLSVSSSLMDNMCAFKCFEHMAGYSFALMVHSKALLCCRCGGYIILRAAVVYKHGRCLQVVVVA